MSDAITCTTGTTNHASISIEIPESNTFIGFLTRKHLDPGIIF